MVKKILHLSIDHEIVLQAKSRGWNLSDRIENFLASGLEMEYKGKVEEKESKMHLHSKLTEALSQLTKAKKQLNKQSKQIHELKDKLEEGKHEREFSKRLREIPLG